MKDSTTIFISQNEANPLSDSLRQTAFVSDSITITTISSDTIISLSSEAVYGTHSVVQAQQGNTTLPEARDNKTPFDDYFALGIILLFLFLFRPIRHFISFVFSGLFNDHVIEKQMEENSLLASSHRQIALVFSIFSISFSVWLIAPEIIAFWNNSTQGNSFPWYYFIYITAGLFAFFLLRIRFLRAIGTIGDCKPFIELLVYFGQLSVIAFGLLLLPLALLIAASPQDAFYNFLLILSFLTIIASLLFYIIRVSQIFFKSSVSIFFLILYLCTFEIAPILLLFSFVSLS